MRISFSTLFSLLAAVCSFVYAAQSVKAAGISDKRKALGNYLNEKSFVISDPHICGGVGSELRLTASLGGEETESDHLPLPGIQALSGIVVSKAVVHQPSIDVPALLRAGLGKAPHALAEDLNLDLFAGFPVPRIATAGDMLAMVEDDYYPVECSDQAFFLNAGIVFDANEVQEHIEEHAVPHSAALLARVRETQSPYFTGALARVNASWQNLGQNAKVAAAKAGLRPPEANPFMNNVAQAVEIVDALDRCADLCRKLAEPGAIASSSLPVPFEVKAGRAVGFTEAPRGALFHDLTLDAEGRVTHASILTPTAQNVANLEADMRLLAEKLVADGAAEDVVRLEIEKLVRAYDPCLSCSVH